VLIEGAWVAMGEGGPGALGGDVVREAKLVVQHGSLVAGPVGELVYPSVHLGDRLFVQAEELGVAIHVLRLDDGSLVSARFEVDHHMGVGPRVVDQVLLYVVPDALGVGLALAELDGDPLQLGHEAPHGITVGRDRGGAPPEVVPHPRHFYCFF